MIITIDGPAGAGKSSVARTLAERLGFRFLDTGATYRAVTLAAVERGFSLDDAEQLLRLTREIKIELINDRVLLDGRDVTAAIRTSEITAQVRYVADNQAVRRVLVELQRTLAGEDDIVTDGRDQGTVVFPHAECKIYLTATPAERARRRQQQLQSRGEEVSLEEVLAQQNSRDRRDAERPVGGMAPASDAVEVLTDGMTPQEVVEHLAKLVEQRRKSG